MFKLIIIPFIFLFSTLQAQVVVYFNFASFTGAKSNSYLETHLTLVGKSLRFTKTNVNYQASVNVSWKIYKAKELVKTSVYNVLSPTTTDSTQKLSFIDSQRFGLDNGNYTIELTVFDNAFPDKKTNYSEPITIFFNRDNKVYISDIQPLESFKKTETQNILSKNGYDLIPYTVNYFPKNQSTLLFYVEAYNVDSLLGKNSKFIYNYYIENSETQVVQQDLFKFQKQNASHINPLLGQFTISNLPSGNYNVVLQLKDSLNTTLAQKKWFFQRQSNAKPIATEEIARTNVNTIEDFFNAYSSTDTLKQFIECLWPRSNNKEREWQQTQLKNKQPVVMRSYLIDYWKAEAGDSVSPLKIWIDYYKLVLQTNALLKCGKQKGYYTDRGRVYLQYGKPDQRNQVNSEPNSYPYEVWQYYRVYDKVTGSFFSNKKFVFANFGIADDCYKLIHSDMRGEVNDSRWKFRLLSRTQKSNNYDETEPSKMFGNNIDENFNNPR